VCFKIHPPQIEQDECIGCNICVQACPATVLEMKGSKAEVIRPTWCIACGHCSALCPTSAIRRQGLVPDKILQEEEPVAPEALERLLRERRSVRVHRSDPVPKEVLERLLDIGRIAPTGTNSQNVGYIVLHDKKCIDELRNKVLLFYQKLFARVASPVQSRVLSLLLGKKAVEQLRFYLPRMKMAQEKTEQGEDPLFHHAPAILMVHSPKADVSSPFNGAVALYGCSLLAHTLGLGCCFNGFLQAASNHDSGIRSFLRIPSQNRCFGAMTLGYTDLRYIRTVKREPAQVIWI